MKSAKIVTIAVIAALALVSLPMVATDWNGADATDSTGPTITEAGYSDSGKAFFYYAKFALNGFNVSSASADTPAAGAGTMIQDNILYATIDNLDVNGNYYLFIEEMTGENVSATVCIALGSGYNHTAAWISIGAGSTGAYVYGNAANSEARSGTLSETVDGHTYRFSLVSGDADAVSSVQLQNALSTKTLADAAHHSVIVEQSIRVSDESDGVNSLSRNYGYSSRSTAAYAGRYADYDVGKYLCIVAFTNIDANTVQFNVKSGDSSYTVDSSYISYGNSERGYAFIAVPESALTAAGVSIDGDYTVEIGDGTAVYATVSESADTGSGSGGNNNTLLYVAIAIVAIVLILAVFLWYRKQEA